MGIGLDKRVCVCTIQKPRYTSWTKRHREKALDAKVFYMKVLYVVLSRSKSLFEYGGGVRVPGCEMIFLLRWTRDFDYRQENRLRCVMLMGE